MILAVQLILHRSMFDPSDLQTYKALTVEQVPYVGAVRGVACVCCLLKVDKGSNGRARAQNNHQLFRIAMAAE